MELKGSTKQYEVKVTENELKTILRFRISNKKLVLTLRNVLVLVSVLFLSLSILTIVTRELRQLVPTRFEVSMSQNRLSITACLVALPVSLILFICKQLLSVTEEELTILSIGTQLSTEKFLFGYRYSKVDKFFLKKQIKNIVINEYFKGFQVLYYLCVLVKVQDENQIVVLFPELLPRLDTLEMIYSKIH